MMGEQVLEHRVQQWRRVLCIQLPHRFLHGA